VDGLGADWKAVKAKGRRRPVKHSPSPVPDIHEDWLAVKGGKHPAYAYIVRWEYPTSALMIFKMAITSKRRTREGVFYQTRYVGIFYKPSGFKVDRYDKPYEGGPLPRCMLCFTLEDVERSIEAHRRNHIDQLWSQMRRLNASLVETANSLKHTEDALHIMRQDPVPSYVLETLPRKASKRLDEPNE
jgi:hypothetical protein